MLLALPLSRANDLGCIINHIQHTETFTWARDWQELLGLFRCLSTKIITVETTTIAVWKPSVGWDNVLRRTITFCNLPRSEHIFWTSFLAQVCNSVLHQQDKVNSVAREVQVPAESRALCLVIDLSDKVWWAFIRPMYHEELKDLVSSSTSESSRIT